jgi:signal peptidase I
MAWLGLLISLVLTGLVAVDATRHGRSWYAWSRLVFFTGVFGAAFWIWTRRRWTRTDHRLSTWQRILLPFAGVPLMLFSLLAVSFIVTFMFQLVRVGGPAMAPTIADQQRVIVNKLAYRVASPRRGEIVLHNYPLSPDKMFIKRVIGVAGDTVRIADGRVYVNDVLLKDDYVPAEFRSHDNWGPQRVAEGYYFVLGDHRNNSSDSRHWGLVPRNYIVGRIAEPKR